MGIRVLSRECDCARRVTADKLCATADAKLTSEAHGHMLLGIELLWFVIRRVWDRVGSRSNTDQW